MDTLYPPIIRLCLMDFALRFPGLPPGTRPQGTPSAMLFSGAPGDTAQLRISRTTFILRISSI